MQSLRQPRAHHRKVSKQMSERCPKCNRLVDMLVTCLCGDIHGCQYCYGKEYSLSAGYKLADVKTKLCIMCKEPIGDLEYQEVTGLARFGQMMFEHKACSEEVQHA